MHKNLAICHIIATVVSADGMIDGAERELLEEAMEDFSLSEEERQDVRDFKSEGAEEVVSNMPEADKLMLRDGLIAATLADGKITPQESAVVKRMTELMGL